MRQSVEKDESDTGLTLQVANQEVKEEVEFDIMAYMAPGMALMFLMFTASYGGRSFLAERASTLYSVC